MQLSRHTSRFVFAVALLLGVAQADTDVARHGPPVKAGTPTEQRLYAPTEDDSFDFVIFGDRTGGPREGIEVLKDAVEMTNYLDPDLVLTVGDLIQGYNKPQQWLKEMREYKDAMSGLDMSWYPVPGNHDVYARPEKPGGHMDLYKNHFGPLYYSFDYKWAHFIVLFSDENLSFRNPAVNQNFSPEQLAWLREDLASAEGDQIFVFLHHPRWTKGYEGCNWDEVHNMFVEDGRPATVFAGHIHTYRSDGQIDNVQYYTLATTGGQRGRLRETATIHHIDFVRVRPDRIAVAVMPVGNVYSGDYVLGEEVDMMANLVRGGWLGVEGEAAISPHSEERSVFHLHFFNTTDRRMNFTAALQAAEGWHFDYEPIDKDIDPGGSFSVAVKATAPRLGDATPQIKVRAVARYALLSGLIQPIESRGPVPVRLSGVEDIAGADPENNGILHLDGSSAVRIDVPEELERYTLECWVRGDEPAGDMALIAKTQASAYGISWCAKAQDLPLPAGWVGTATGYLTLPVETPWEWHKWTHVALVFDGRKASLFIDGKLQAGKKTSAAATHNAHPLYIGADPDHRGEPISFFAGHIDEVRLSDMARYNRPFTPAKVFKRDNHTVALFHFDRAYGSAYLDDSGHGYHGWAVGRPKIERARR